MSSQEPDQAWPMDQLQAVVASKLAGDQAFAALLPKKQRKLILKLAKESATAISKDLLKRAPKMLAWRRKSQAAFETRNLCRWRKAFDLIETLWVCSEEMGRNFHQHFRADAVLTQDYVFEAISSIHAKSLLVGEEMICLMKGGFADAALTRWRTMHELSVMATLLRQEGQDLALRYLAHADVQAAKDIDPDDLTDDVELQATKERADYALSRFGSDLKKHYGWGCELIGKPMPTFEDLEKRAGKTEARSIYKYASQHIHSNHRPYDALLGVAESVEHVLLVGSSNAGMVGPLTLASMSLAEVTTLYLNTRPNFDRVVCAGVLMRMATRMNRLATRLEEKTLRAAKKRKSKT
ncbi:DUF5677 domain-containing protein [Xanthobacter agilis]|uniref:Uncharacterized protein n=1 Tax=Xanthobacter agilis TaxID=47492 RepID=A0ABU0LHE4_XANAG|nr:DUF5677 domain-containing protein [Xanthobacter agilis]MDQ0506561.1 hypothetical protein [Xanthobacter agilis]